MCVLVCVAVVHQIEQIFQYHTVRAIDKLGDYILTAATFRRFKRLFTNRKKHIFNYVISRRGNIFLYTIVMCLQEFI